MNLDRVSPHPDRKLKTRNELLREELFSFPVSSQLPSLSLAAAVSGPMACPSPKPSSGLKLRSSPVRKRPGSPLRPFKPKRVKQAGKPTDTNNSSQVYDFIQSPPRARSVPVAFRVFDVKNVEVAYGSSVLTLTNEYEEVRVVVAGNTWQIGDKVETCRFLPVSAADKLYVCDAINPVPR